MARRTAPGVPPAFRVSSAIEPRRLPLGDLDAALGVLAAGADIGEHVEDDEVGERRRRLLADRSQAARGQRALGRLAEDRVLGIGRPDRVLSYALRVSEISDRCLQPLVVLIRLQQEGDQRLAGLRMLGVGHRQDREADVELGRLADPGPTGHKAWSMSSAISFLRRRAWRRRRSRCRCWSRKPRRPGRPCC